MPSRAAHVWSSTKQKNQRKCESWAVSQKLMIFWVFLKQPSLEFTQGGKREISVKLPDWFKLQGWISLLNLKNGQELKKEVVRMSSFQTTE